MQFFPSKKNKQKLSYVEHLLHAWQKLHNWSIFDIINNKLTWNARKDKVIGDGRQWEYAEYNPGPHATGSSTDNHNPADAPSL